MRSALGITGIIACVLALPALATLAFVKEYETPPMMGMIAVAALTACAFIIAGEEERYVRVIGWIVIAIAASLVCAAIDTVTDSADRLPTPALIVLLLPGAAVLRGHLRSPSWWNGAAVQSEVMPMNLHVDVKEATSSPKPTKVGLLRRMLNFLVTLLSSPKGDQGGWEGGARGL